MTLPLIILAFFAIFAGFVGVPADFPVFGPIFSPMQNFYHHFVGATLIHELEPPTIAFNAVPVLFSFVVALGGLGLGWWVYWRKPLKAGEPDPLVSALGPIYTLLENKYYLDEIYGAVFVRPSQWIANVAVVQFLDDGVIDGILHTFGRVATWIGDLLKLLNTWLIDGVGDGIPRGIASFGGWFRRVQTGRVQQYLLVVLIAALLIGLVFALSSGMVTAG
jgi:NADH-quinone oxidoreductase subunit L